MSEHEPIASGRPRLRYRLTVEMPEHDDDGISAIGRLRSLLKALARRYRVRCVKVEQERDTDS